MRAIAEKLPLTAECHHWTRLREVPWDLHKYWQQRHTLFPHYDDGIHMTDEAWYGVTPGPVAARIAADVPALFPDRTTIVDAFAGVGGNCIAFAMSGHWERIIAVEADAASLACAQHNAELYGVFDYITWVLGDSFEYMALLNAEPRPTGASTLNGSMMDCTGSMMDCTVATEMEGLDDDLIVDATKTVVFGSPPWGGPGYNTDAVFDVGRMEPYNLSTVHEAYKKMDHVLYLPRTSDLRQIARLAPEGSKIEVVQYCVEGASKAMAAYIAATPRPGEEDGEDDL